MHAYIINGGAQKQRDDKLAGFMSEWDVAQIDQIHLTPNPTSIGISDVKAIAPRLQFKPFRSPVVAAIIHQAETMTIEAQNALLKILEEPPATAKIILETASLETLLVTTRSRCQIITLADQHEPLDPLFAEQFMAMLAAPVSRRLAYVDTIEKTQAPAWLAQAMLTVRQTIVSEPNLPNKPQLLHLAHNLFSAQQLLDSNISYKLILDALLLDTMGKIPLRG